MSLINQWKELVENSATQEDYNEFWNVYIPKEQSNYEYLLNNSKEEIKGNIKDLSEKFNMDSVTFLGFLDGINSSLKEELSLEEIEEETEIELNVDFEKLLYNMYDAKADWLYTLEEWNLVLDSETRNEIHKKFNESKIFVNTDNKVGRNDPCPCGSGKKYKKCCMNK
ncbi:SEC-C metal-binding domain-containing protein [Clostridiaceae bacterium HSG29]|nr:SEC-C metal-binding domain-containing protein [Clostridiaceae bacterium HSG29]